MPAVTSSCRCCTRPTPRGLLRCPSSGFGARAPGSLATSSLSLLYKTDSSGHPYVAVDRRPAHERQRDEEVVLAMMTTLNGRLDDPDSWMSGLAQRRRPA